MADAWVISVNVGTPVDAAWAGRLRRTAIDKHPVCGPVQVHPLGLEGDEVADTRFHGGVDKAVYAYQAEDLRRWAGRLDLAVVETGTVQRGDPIVVEHRPVAAAPTSSISAALRQVMPVTRGAHTAAGSG